MGIESITLGLNAGTSIEKAAELAIKLAKVHHVPVCFSHNGVQVTVTEKDNLHEVVGGYVVASKTIPPHHSIKYFHRNGLIIQRTDLGETPLSEAEIEDYRRWFEANHADPQSAHFKVALMQLQRHRTAD